MMLPDLESYYKQKHELELLIEANSKSEAAREARYLLNNLNQNLQRQIEVMFSGAALQVAYAKDLLKAAIHTNT